ncbi:protein NO VEIN domain-containing protein [Thermofilum pendens]|uniref:Protein NO VEIN C-terminal domain-containing protein n=1 Tax=Thermofilum pendens (strain DSM 2475 / Hrk 5) TaxID=368408 RepID=A1RZP3_THEPD|nr:hypothetical protein Tpen_1275 [Thermofilum pendens Hrk 5]
MIKYEELHGRRAQNVSSEKKGYDIESKDREGNTRYIEVKKRDLKYGFVFLTHNEFMNFLRNENSWLYIVYKENGETRVIEISREKVLKHAKPELKWRVSLRKEVTGRRARNQRQDST